MKDKWTEMEKVEDEALKQMSDTCDIVDILSKQTHTTLYPEYNFKKPYGVWTGGLPIYAVLPFYRQLIIHLEPHENSRKFQDLYGITIEEMRELVELERIIILLRRPYSLYPRYYNNLFEKHIPRNNRIEELFIKKYPTIKTKFIEVVERKIADEGVPEILADKIKQRHGDCNIEIIVKNSLVNRMVKLNILGFFDVKDFVKDNNLSDAYKGLHAYNRAFAVPFIDSLGGWDNLDAKHVEMVNCVCHRKGSTQLYLPRDFVLWLNEELDYTYPMSVESGKSFIEEVNSWGETSENHEILKKLQEELESSKYDNSLKLAKQSRDLITEIKKNLVKLENRKISFQKWTTAPIHYACSMISPIAFSLAANQISRGNITCGMLLGAGGLATTTIDEATKKIEEVFVTSNYKYNPVATLIWKRIRGRKKDKNN